jgi:hypothetical protein
MKSTVALVVQRWRKEKWVTRDGKGLLIMAAMVRRDAGGMW